jgi:K+-sensing histidine kinase KdpD
VSLHSASVASALLEHAQTARVTEIILARGRGMRGSDIKRTLLHQTSGIDVHVLREERAAESARKPVAAG